MRGLIATAIPAVSVATLQCAGNMRCNHWAMRSLLPGHEAGALSPEQTDTNRHNLHPYESAAARRQHSAAMCASVSTTGSASTLDRQ